MPKMIVTDDQLDDAEYHFERASEDLHFSCTFCAKDPHSGRRVCEECFTMQEYNKARKHRSRLLRLAELH